MTANAHGRKLIILVGTSVFSSASWNLDKPGNPLVERIRTQPQWAGYAEWLRSGRTSPTERISMAIPNLPPASGYCRGQDVRLWIRNLHETDREDLLFLVATDEISVNREYMRYSAEVSTLLAMKRAEQPHGTVSNFLGKYDTIELIHSENNDDGMLAAQSNHQIIELLSDPPGSVKLSLNAAIEGDSLANQARSVAEYVFRSVRAGETHLIVSGGFKIYAMMAGMVLGRLARDQEWSDRLRVFYLHEDGGRPGMGDGLIEQHSFELLVDGHKVGLPGEGDIF